MKTPTPKAHKTGQAYIYWQRKCIYFGKFGTPEADEKYWQWRKSMTGGASPTVKQYLVIDLLNLYASLHTGRKTKDKYKAITDLGPLVRYHCHEYTPLGTPKVGAGRLLSASDMVTDKVSEVFKRSTAWGTMIQTDGIGVYWLSPL